MITALRRWIQDRHDETLRVQHALIHAQTEGRLMWDATIAEETHVHLDRVERILRRWERQGLISWHESVATLVPIPDVLWTLTEPDVQTFRPDAFGAPFPVRLTDTTILPEHQTPERSPVIDWPYGLTDLRVVLIWLQTLEMHVLVPAFSAIVLPTTLARVLTEAYGAPVIQAPSHPVTTIDTYRNWEGGFLDLWRGGLRKGLDPLTNEAVAEELRRRRLDRDGLGRLLLTYAIHDENFHEHDRPALARHCQAWIRRLDHDGDSVTQWLKYLRDEADWTPLGTAREQDSA